MQGSHGKQLHKFHRLLTNFAFFSSSDSCVPLLHPHLQRQRLPQETLPRLHLALPQLKLIPPKHCAHNKRQLHLRDVPAHAGPRAVAERNERGLLLLGDLLPALRAEGVGVGAPDVGGVVDCVARHGQDGTSGKVAVRDGDAGADDHAGQAERGGAVDAHGFLDDEIEAVGRR